MTGVRAKVSNFDFNILPVFWSPFPLAWSLYGFTFSDDEKLRVVFIRS